MGAQDRPWGRRCIPARITSLGEILEQGGAYREAGVIKKLLPGLKTEVVDVGIIQKMTSNGQSTRFKAIVAAGNEDGYLGGGQGKAKQDAHSDRKGQQPGAAEREPHKAGLRQLGVQVRPEALRPFRVRGKGRQRGH